MEVKKGKKKITKRPSPGGGPIEEIWKKRMSTTEKGREELNIIDMSGGGFNGDRSGREWTGGREWTDDRWHKGVEIFRRPGGTHGIIFCGGTLDYNRPQEGDPEPFAKCDTVCAGGRNGRVIIMCDKQRRNEPLPLPLPHLKQDETVFGGTIASGTIITADPKPFLYLPEWAENNHSDMGGGVK